MRRRNFLQTILAAGAARRGSAATTPAAGGEKTWLFWDLWKVDGLDGAELRQGRPRWRPEHTFQEPRLASLSSWPTVIREGDRWRMFYSAEWRPLTLLSAESDDGLHWTPVNRPAEEFGPPGARKLAPDHLFTLASGSGGSVYHDPLAADGFPFKIFAIQSGDLARERALADPSSPFHQFAREQPEGLRYFVDHLTLKSRDGYRWEADYGAVWNQPGWHPEPPVYGFYNAALKRHSMTSRPGHGDRRVVLQHSADLREWSGPELLLQPDASDAPQVEFYGMPVFPYGGAWVGLLWVFHPTGLEPPGKYNRSVGWIDCQLAYSYDGLRFQRGKREAFIGLNEPGELGGGHLQPSALVEDGDEIRIYSTAGRHTHGMGELFEGRKDDLGAITLHTLRKDGFNYLASTGGWARMLSKPFLLNGPGLKMNAAAPQGEVRYRIVTVENDPIEGLGFEDCVALHEADSTAWDLRWKNKSLAEVVGQPVRLELEWLNGRIYAFRGDYHFIDAQDWHLLEDGKPINPRWFDY